MRTIARFRKPLVLIGLCLLLLLGTACGSKATPPTLNAPAALPTLNFPTAIESKYQSDGGGEPRGPGYWLTWNSCAENNQAAVAASNGGAAAGWYILDDLLAEPGLVLGNYRVANCQEGIRLLQGQDLTGADRREDMAYQLAIQLLTTQLNLGAKAEYCQAVDEAVMSGQVLLLKLGFTGSGEYLGVDAPAEDLEQAKSVSEQLISYNIGQLCK